jgi:hypothetical protein
MNEPIADLLSRNHDWVAAARNSLIDVSYAERAPIDPVAIAQRDAFDAARRGRYEAAEAKLTDINRELTDKVLKGWLVEQIATFVHQLDSARSQTVLLAANDLNPRVTKPLAGITYARMNTTAMDQAREACSNTQRYADGNALLIHVNGLLSDLVFKEDGVEEFEESLKEVGLLLGFRSQRPEKEGSGKLDVLWGIGGSRYLLLPCKSGATTSSISKRYTDEVSGALTWFRSQYDATCRPFAALIHPSFHLGERQQLPPN